MHNPYRGGTPDVWYSGKSDCWIEYKWQTLPKSGVIIPDLSPLQLKWLTDRDHEGRTCLVIVGTPDGAMGSGWAHEWSAGINRKLMTDKETAQFIVDEVLL